MARWWVGSLMAGAVAGCTLLVDTSELDEGSALAPVPPRGPILSDARAPTDSTTDAVVDAKPGSTTCPPGAFLCDDFEQGLDKQWEIHLDPNGSVAAETPGIEPHAGKRAFGAISKAVDASTGFQSELRFAFPTKLEAGKLFVMRAWIRFEGTYFPETALAKLRAPSGEDDLNLKITGDGRLKIDADVPGAGPELTAKDPVPLDRWVCMEWQTALGTPGHSRLILDGKTWIDADENNVSPLGFREIGIGFVGLAGPNQRVFMDDVVLSSALVGCP